MASSLWLDDLNLDAVDDFAEFFNLSPNEVRAMSPNARIGLQLGYEALEDANVAPRSLAGKSWSVFTAVNDSGWREHQISTKSIEGKLYLNQAHPPLICPQIIPRNR